MLEDAQNLPNDAAALKDLVTTLASELKSRDILIEKLKHQLDGMRQHRFGSRYEALDQLALTLEDEKIAASAQEPAPVDADTDQSATLPKGKPKRKPLPGHLPRNETTLSPGDACGECGGALKVLGEDVTEELEYIPGRFVVNRIVRPRMACTCCETFHQAVCRRGRLSAGVPAPGFWPMCWSINTPIICRSTGKVRCSPVRGSIWTAPPWPVGLVNPPPCSNFWRIPSRVMY